jgi:O-antigen/teichoic acid export membrane protein
MERSAEKMAPESKSIAKPALALTASRVVGQFSALAIFFLSARFLSIEEFGVFAIASAVTAVIGQLAWVGFHEYALKQKLTTENSGPLFFAVLCAGVFLSIALALLAGPVSYLFGDQRLARLILWWSATPIFAGGLSVILALYYNEGRFRFAAISGIICHGAALATAIAAFTNGLGLNALIIHKLLVTSLLPVALLIALSKMPKPKFELSSVVEILKFVRNFTAMHIVDFGASYGADLVLGFIAGPAATGVYRFGARIVLAMDALVAAPLNTLSWVEFSKWRGDDTGLRKSVLDFLSISSIITIAIFTGLAAIARPLILEFAGEGWADAIIVVQILAIVTAFKGPLLAILPAALGAKDQVQWLPIVRIAGALASIGAILVFARYGTAAAAASQAAALLIVAPFSLLLLRKYMALHHWKYLKVVGAAALAGAIMWLWVGWIHQSLIMAPAIVTLFLQVTSGAAFFMTLILVLSPKYAALLLGHLTDFFPEPLKVRMQKLLALLPT